MMLRPPSCSRTVECPIHVAEKCESPPRGRTILGAAVGKELRGGLGARFRVRLSRRNRSTFQKFCGSLSGQGLLKRFAAMLNRNLTKLRAEGDLHLASLSFSCPRGD